MPIADASISLPNVRPNACGGAALNVFDESANMVGRYMLSVHHDIGAAAVACGAVIVIVRHDVESGLTERQLIGIEIDEVRPIFVYEVFAPQEPVLNEGGGGHRIGLGEARICDLPCPDRGSADDTVGHHHRRTCIKVLRIETLPPLANSVGLGERGRVVANACQRPFAVVAIGGLEPAWRPGGVVADAETQALRARHRGPQAGNVLLGADVHRIPSVVAGIVSVKIVVVVGQADKVFRSCALVERHQPFRLPALRAPQIVDLHEAEARWVTICLDVVVVGRIALQIHPAGIPVALLGHALRRPMRPDSELGVAKPIRIAVILD